MTHAVINQYGRYIRGAEYDEIVDAVMHDKEALTIDGVHVEIVKHTVDANGDKVTLVEVQAVERTA